MDGKTTRSLARVVRFRTVVLVAVVSVVLASSVGFAAALTITPKRLTVYSGSSSAGVTTCTLAAPAADTYSDDALLAAGTNFGTATTLHVRSESLANKRTYIRFDLSSCSIPASARVETASMKLFLSTAPSSSRTYEAQRVTESWSETGLTGNSEPAASTSVTASASTGTTSNVTLAWNVLADVKAFVAGTATNYGWRLDDSAEGALIAIEGRFSSREHSTATQRPSLVVTYYP